MAFDLPFVVGMIAGVIAYHLLVWALESLGFFGMPGRAAGDLEPTGPPQYEVVHVVGIEDYRAALNAGLHPTHVQIVNDDWHALFVRSRPASLGSMIGEG